MKKQVSGNVECAEKPEYDPWEWIQGDDPANNPGDLLISCAKQALRITEANKDNVRIRDQALDLANMATGMFTTFEWKGPDGAISEDAVRHSLVAMYMVGVESARLAIATKQDSVSIDVRHSKPGGSRELRDKIREVWASGKYSSKDICAEEEWRGLGFGSLKAARNALINIPPHTCAQQVPTTRNGNSTHEN